jgi:hypothetical protein
VPYHVVAASFLRVLEPTPSRAEAARRALRRDKSGFAFRLRPSDYARTSRLRRDKSSIQHLAFSI